MTISRATTFLLCLLLFSLVGAGVLIYRLLPTLLEEQALAFLQPYGVREVSLGQLEPGLVKTRIETLDVSGATEGVAFTASITDLVLGYSWQRLLQRELESITLAELDLALRATSAASQSASPAISVATLLPYALLSRLPTRHLKLENWVLHYQPLAAEPLTVRGQLRLAEQWDLHFDAQHKDLVLGGVARGSDSAPLEMELTLHDAALPLADLRARLDPGEEDSWHWSLEGELQYSPFLAWSQAQDWYPLPAETLPTLVGHSAFTAAIDHPDTLDVQGVSWKELLPLFNVKASANNTIEDLKIADTVSAVSGEFQAVLGLDRGRPNLVLSALELAGELNTSQLFLPEQLRQWLRWDEQLPVRWHTPGTVNVSAPSADSWSLQFRDTTLAVGNDESEQRWEALSIDAALNLQEPTQSALQLSANIKSRAQQRQLPDLRLQFSHPGAAAEHTFELLLVDAAESVQLTAQGSLDSSSGNGSYQTSLRSLDLIKASNTLTPLLQHFSKLGDELLIESGTVILNSEFTSNGYVLDGVLAQSALTIQDLGGAYAEYRFSGIDLTANWTGTNNWQTREAMTVSVESLFVGVELTNTQARISLPEPTPITQPVVSIEQFSTHLFGGRVVQTKPQQWDFAAAANSISLAAENWQLSEIVSLQQTRDITALGVLDGELPMTLAAGRLSIEHGYLRARAPGGTIRYLPGEDGAALAATSSELAMAIDLLSDFQYQNLGSTVELDQAGNLLLKLKLAGSNPKLYEGHPIEFNINLEQNIDPLLQSLRLGNRLVEQIDERLR